MLERWLLGMLKFGEINSPSFMEKNLPSLKITFIYHQKR